MVESSGTRATNSGKSLALLGDLTQVIKNKELSSVRPEIHIDDRVMNMKFWSKWNMLVFTQVNWNLFYCTSSVFDTVVAWVAIVTVAIGVLAWVPLAAVVSDPIVYVAIRAVAIEVIAAVVNDPIVIVAICALAIVAMAAVVNNLVVIVAICALAIVAIAAVVSEPVPIVAICVVAMVTIAIAVVAFHGIALGAVVLTTVVKVHVMR